MTGPSLSLRTMSTKCPIWRGAHHAGQYELNGPDVMISPKTVEVLRLAFHELSTNAVKYGALSVSDGVVLVDWAIVERRGATRLSLDWIERGQHSFAA